MSETTNYNNRFEIVPKLTKGIVKEDLLLDVYGDRWDYSIQERGQEYYFRKKVIKVHKDNNNYFAKVSGSNNSVYDVVIKVVDDNIECKCSCPCTYLCKHEYAVLMAISNGKYTEVKIKDIIEENVGNIGEIIKEIPALELKEYILDNIDSVSFNYNSFKERFLYYYPLQSYEFYYNNLYNALMLDMDYEGLIKDYLNNVKQYITSKQFMEVIKIVKAIVEVFNDSGRINVDNYFVDILPLMGMFLRVVDRKINNDDKIELLEWINKLKSNNYYDNYYLEDVILSVEN